MTWRRLGAVPPPELVGTRLELHYAAQIPAGLGIARGRPEPDFGHHALTWDAEQRALVSALVREDRPYRAGIRFPDRTLLLIDGRGARVGTFALAGRTLRDGLAWLERETRPFSGDADVPLALPAQELPPHPVGGGARFGEVQAPAAAEIEAWYANLARVLESLRPGERMSPVRVWSHHFDLDTVLDLGGERTLGFGLSPGDEFYAEPYLYVLPSSFPEVARSPAIEPPGEWRTEVWTGAVLRGSEIARLAPEAQSAAAERFYRTAGAAVRTIVGGGFQLTRARTDT